MFCGMEVYRFHMQLIAALWMLIWSILHRGVFAPVVRGSDVCPPRVVREVAIISLHWTV